MRKWDYLTKTEKYLVTWMLIAFVLSAILTGYINFVK